jgi:WD40 repeat protein
VTCVSYSRDGRYVATGSEDSTAKIWDITAGKCLGSYSDSSRAQVVYGVDFSPNMSLLATANFNRVIELWDLSRAALWKSFGGAKRGDAATSEGHRYGVNVVKFSPDGRYLASGSDDNTIRIWNIQ